MRKSMTPLDLFLLHQIEQMVSTMGQLTLEQIYRMLRRYDESVLDRHIYILSEKQNRINFDKDTNKLTARIESKRRSEVAQERLTTAFWVLAAFGDNHIRYYDLSMYPTQFFWMENKPHRLFDLTYLYGDSVTMEAINWSKGRKSYLPSAQNTDFCDHIALVFNKKDGEIAVKNHFTRYCILDADHKPIFYPALEGFGEDHLYLPDTPERKVDCESSNNLKE